MTTTTSRFPVVGIVASKDSIDRLRALFHALPDDSGMAFVVAAAHGIGSCEIDLVELVGRWTSMPVVPARDGRAVEKNVVYVLRSETTVTMQGGILSAAPSAPGAGTVTSPVDLFLASLAADRNRDACSLILSGSGGDGLRGTRSVRDGGGLTIAPAVACDAGRPAPSRDPATRPTELELPMEQIVERLLEFGRRAATGRDADCPGQAAAATGDGASPGRDRLLGPSPRSTERGADPALPRRWAEMRMLERYAPAHVVVDCAGDVAFYSAGTGRFLEPSAGPPSRQLASMARVGLRDELVAALQTAIDSGQTVVRERLQYDVDGRMEQVDVSVEPMSGAEGDYYLVVFDRGSPPRRTGAARDRLTGDIDAGAAARGPTGKVKEVVRAYESRLAQLAARSEQLRSANEELRARNRDLTVKCADLDRVNNDLRNLLESTDVATVFLDRDGAIRNFTPTATLLFNLIATDRGRRLTDITTNFEYGDLASDIRSVLDGNGTRERTVTRRSPLPTHYMLRVLPYWAPDRTIDGAVVTFVDITGTLEAENHQRLLIEELNHRVKNMLSVVIALATQSIAHSRSPQEFFDSFIGRVHALSSTYGLVSRGRWGHVALRDVVKVALQPARAEGMTRLATEGPPVLLTPRAALALGQVVHELSSNAVRYGALSRPYGRVLVSWHIDRWNSHRELVINWIEADGPPVSEPEHRGFGVELIERQLNYELDGSAVLEYATHGLRAVLTIPLDPDLVTDVDGTAS